MQNPENGAGFGVVDNIRNFASSAIRSKMFNLLTLLLIVVAIPLTVLVAQQQQEIRQRAENIEVSCEGKPKGFLCVSDKDTLEMYKFCDGNGACSLKKCQSDFDCNDGNICGQYCAPNPMFSGKICSGENREVGEVCIGDVPITVCDGFGNCNKDYCYNKLIHTPCGANKECNGWGECIDKTTSGGVPTPTSGGEQPTSPPQGNNRCTYNGEPYNYGDKIWTDCGADGGGIPKVCNGNNEWLVNGDYECARPDFCPGTCNDGGGGADPRDTPPVGGQAGSCEELGLGCVKVEEYYQCGGDQHSNCDNRPDGNKAGSNETLYVKKYQCSADGTTRYITRNDGRVPGRCNVPGGSPTTPPGTGTCQSATSLQARFQVGASDPWGTTKQAFANQQVNAGVFKNNTSSFASGTGISAEITGPGGFKQNINPSSSNSFKPQTAGTYKLKATCASLSNEATLNVLASPCQSLQPRFQKDINSSWTDNLTDAQTNKAVKVAIFKDGDTNLAGSGATAKITGPDNYTETVSTTAVDSFTPLKEGEYMLSATCGAINQTAKLKALLAIPECDSDKVSMEVVPVEHPREAEIFAGDSLNFTVAGEQGLTYPKDELEQVPAGIVNYDNNGYFSSGNKFRTQKSGTIKWTHKWRNCAGTTSNCAPEAQACSKTIQEIIVREIPKYRVEGIVFTDTNGNKELDSGEEGYGGIRVVAKNEDDPSAAPVTVTTGSEQSAKGTFVFENLPRSNYYTGTIENLPDNFYVTTNYPLKTALKAQLTGASRIKIGIRQKTAQTKIPEGKVTESNCRTGIKGYACIPSDQNKISVDIYNLDGQKLQTAEAKEAGGLGNCQGNHGFTFNIPPLLKDGGKHLISFRAVNPGEGPNPELTDSPKTIVCENPAELDGVPGVGAGDYNVILSWYEKKPDCSGITKPKICNYINAQGKIDFASFVKWFQDALPFLQ